ncbi:MAG: peptidoglycan synthetase [Flavobacteriales bacterium]|nr:peptidoglycan synthetase [Flavobacteriales bacterium]
MRVHFIAVGGSAMHNMALAMHQMGHQVTGSDDEVFEPSKTRLAAHGLLPEKMGWDPDRITTDLEAVILGMHARADNPELLKAQEMKLRIYSYPEFIYEQCRDKKRVVIGGSHGKTSITAMVLHVLSYHKVDCDYMVGAQLEGFDTMVRLTNEAKIVVLEGDEYLSSPIDRRPKFHLYKPHIALISGIAWDHVNVFPTFENYVDQFGMFIDLIEKDGTLIYCIEDEEVRQLADECQGHITKLPYGVPSHFTEDGKTYLLTDVGKVPLKIFGNHNLMNLTGARLVCGSLGITNAQFYEAIQSFKGAANRLELVAENGRVSVFKDFAHSPSKLKATVQAVKQQFPDRKLTACMELHTFSSLTAEFLKEYAGSMDAADEAIVYFNPHTLKHKKLPELDKKDVKKAFARKDLEVYTDSADLRKHLLSQKWRKRNLLMMSSGTFDGIDVAKLGKKVAGD